MIKETLANYSKKVRSSLSRRVNDTRIRELAREVAGSSVLQADAQPIVFFNASTRLGGLSLNAGFSLITAWGLRLAGIPVIHFVCQAGMSRCVLGTDRDHLEKDPPCKKCIAHSQTEYENARTLWFNYEPDDKLKQAMAGLSITALEDLSYGNLPLGALVMPALRWELRKHHLTDDEPTRFLYREFILSAWNVAQNFTKAAGTDHPTGCHCFQRPILS